MQPFAHCNLTFSGKSFVELITIRGCLLSGLVHSPLCNAFCFKTHAHAHTHRKCEICCFATSVFPPVRYGGIVRKKIVSPSLCFM